MKKKLAFFIAVLYNKSCVTENRYGKPNNVCAFSSVGRAVDS